MILPPTPESRLAPHHAAAAVLALLLVPAGLVAQSQGTEHTLVLDDPSARPAATIDQVAWIAGSWTGSGFGGSVEEVWARPTAGTMVGMYKHRGEDGVSFYELQLIVEEEGSLTWKVKHFGADMTAWEEKDGYASFPLVKLTEDAAYFAGLTLKRLGPDEMQGYVRVRSGETVREEALSYKRTPLEAPVD